MLMQNHQVVALVPSETEHVVAMECNGVVLAPSIVAVDRAHEPRHPGIMQHLRVLYCHEDVDYTIDDFEALAREAVREY